MTTAQGAGTCQGCGKDIPASKGGHPRKWCGDRCRKQTLYAGTCPDCGKPTPYNGRKDKSGRCQSCAFDATKAGTRQWLLDSIQEWHDRYGEIPSASDWNTGIHKRLSRQRQEMLAERFKDRKWPTPTNAMNHFGSWKAFVLEAGFQPRPPGRPRTRAN